MATIGVGMLGYAFMGKAHSNAYRKIAYLTWPPPLEPRLVGIAGRNAEAVQQAAERYGFEYGTDDWRRLIADDSIGLFDNSGPNALHAEPTIAAAQAGTARLAHRAQYRRQRGSAQGVPVMIPRSFCRCLWWSSKDIIDRRHGAIL